MVAVAAQVWAAIEEVFGESRYRREAARLDTRTWVCNGRTDGAALLDSMLIG